MGLGYRVHSRLRAIRALAATTAAALVITVLPVAPATASELFTFEGGGWGHSVGMSQYGAYGMSQEGFSWEEILTHYFTGTSAAPVAEHLRQPVWVNLTMENSSLTFRVKSIGDGSVPVTFSIGTDSVAVQPGQSVTVTRLANGNCDLSTPSGTFGGTCYVDGQWDGWNESPTTAIEIADCYLTNWNGPGGPTSEPCAYSHGSLYVRPDNNTNTVNSSINIDTEAYLLGIAEMPYSWADGGGAAALQAQAVAARSYAYARARLRPDPAARPWCWCQLYDTTYDQNYVGYGHGNPAWVDAVRSTEHQVLTHPSVTEGGELLPISTFYSSSTFGRTESSEDAFLEPIAYLKSVDDHWSGLVPTGNPYGRWSKSFTGSQLASLLPGMSTVTGAAITTCSPTGAALEITFYGSGGPQGFHTRDLRGKLGLLSQQVVTLNTPDGSSPCSQSDPPSTTTTTTVAETVTTTTAPPTTTTTVAESTTTTTVLPATVPTNTDTCPTYDFSITALLSSQRMLGYGANGADVADVQRMLFALAHYEGARDGLFGQRTTAAVRSFQDAKGLHVDGIVGPRTRGEISSLHTAAVGGSVLTADGSLLRRGIDGATVRALQAILEVLGFQPGPVDGLFGSRTTTAVQLFQQSQNLTADGIVGVQSRATLTQELDLHGFGICDG